MAPKRFASLSFDLDNKWSYMKTHGDSGWEKYPTYLPALTPYVIDILKERELKITFFVVGIDADIDENKAAIHNLAAAGHEIGNHSYNHEPWLHSYTYDQIIAEIATAGELIEKITGILPVGFRGPGFIFSKNTLTALSKLGYQYDASLLPTFLGPIARMYYFWTSDLDEQEKKKRKALFGGWKLGLNPLRPFYWDLQGSSILEIPVTTMPLFKMPIHLSYIIYLARFSFKLAEAYLKFGLTLCRLNNVEPSILLHPLDFLDGEEVPELKFFPGMNLSKEYKKKVVDMLLDYLLKHFEVITMQQHVSHVKNKGINKYVSPSFS